MSRSLTAPRATPGPATLPMARILIIEDNPANMRMAAFLVRSAGHTVLSATDAESGLTLARAEKPDLILSDIQLPGMDGLEATMLLKRDEATRLIPVIALTTLPSQCATNTSWRRSPVIWARRPGQLRTR